METDFLSIQPETQGLVSCALRLKAPETTDRTPTHFILLLDISESMMDDHKLDHVKRCTELLLNFVTGVDCISLISFGETATLHLKKVAALDSNKDYIKSVIRDLKTNGCTNLSAGLGYVYEVCQGETMKTGLLLLTDGHANRGVHVPALLRTMISNIKFVHPTVSMNCIAYGHDHNAELLKGVAEDCQGSYSIVNSIEDTALAFGDAIGGLLSCAFQNVYVEVPANTIVHGSHKCSVENGSKRILIGDVYSGTAPLVLFELPIGTDASVRVKGMELPTFKIFDHTPVLTVAQGRQIDLELTKHRYTCVSLMEYLQKWHSLSQQERDALPSRIRTFEEALGDPLYVGNLIMRMLLQEVVTLKDTLSRIQRHDGVQLDQTILTQHIASVGLGRGFSSPAPLRQRRRPGFRAYDPVNEQEVEADPVEHVSVFQNTVQAQIASQMMEMSQHPF
jgi:hypothetical protein